MNSVGWRVFESWNQFKPLDFNSRNSLLTYESFFLTCKALNCVCMILAICFLKYFLCFASCILTYFYQDPKPGSSGQFRFQRTKLLTCSSWTKFRNCDSKIWFRPFKCFTSFKSFWIKPPCFWSFLSRKSDSIASSVFIRLTISGIVSDKILNW